MDANNQPHQVERYVEMMLERRVEGLVTVANWLLFDISVLEDISDRQLPTVVVGRDLELPTVNSVFVDNEAGGYAAVQHLYELGHRDISDSASSFDASRNLTRQFIQSGTPFTALLAFDDISAYGAIRALSERSLRVPDDCSVIGFDDVSTSALFAPGLTTVRQPM
jgi:LacI family transcriptional regulator